MRVFDSTHAARWITLWLCTLTLALAAGSAPAFADNRSSSYRYEEATGRWDVVLYEVTEDMYLLDADERPVTDLAHAVRRVAVAHLAGSAKLGTPLCPDEVLFAVPTAKECTINATGTDDLSLANGTGTLGGSFTVVVQGDNAVDAPEFVVMTGRFTGDVDLSPAFASIAPLGYITSGIVTIEEWGGQFAFRGTFRLPFSVTEGGGHGKPDRGRDAFYLGDDARPISVRQSERALGMPTVRIEIKFE